MAKTAIIIVNYRTPWHLNKCLESVFKHTEDFHVFLVQNSPDVESLKVSDKFKEKYPQNLTIKVNKENLGYVGGINSVYEETQIYQYICILNSDVIVTHNWLKKMVDILDLNDNIVQISPDSNQYYPDKFFVPKFLKNHVIKHFPVLGSKLYLWFNKKLLNKTIDTDITFTKSSVITDFCNGACNIFRRKYFDELGYYCDPKIVHGYGDDFDLSLYLRQFGDIGACHSSYVFHFVNLSFNKINDKKIYQKKFLQFLNQAYVVHKWRDKLTEYIKNLTPNEIFSLTENQHFVSILQLLKIFDLKPDIIDLIKSNKNVEIGKDLGIEVNAS